MTSPDPVVAPTPVRPPAPVRTIAATIGMVLATVVAVADPDA